MEYTHNTHTQAYNIGVHSKKIVNKRQEKKTRNPIFIITFLYTQSDRQKKKLNRQTDAEQRTQTLTHSQAEGRGKRETEKREKKSY